VFNIKQGKSYYELATEKILGWDSGTFAERVRQYQNLAPGEGNHVPLICFHWGFKLTGEEARIMLQADRSLWPTQEEVARNQPLRH